MYSFLLMPQYLGPSTILMNSLTDLLFVINGHFYVLGFNSGISKSENGVQF